MSDTPVTEEDVRHVASLARIDVDDEAVERFTEQFVEILDAFETLDAVPDIEPEATYENVLRTDRERRGLSQADALANAPRTDDGYFEGPPVS